MGEIEKLWGKWAECKSRESRDRLFEAVWTLWYQKLTVYVRNAFQADSDTAGDMARDILIKVFGKIGLYNPDYSFSTWIYRIAANSVTDAIRSPFFRNSLTGEEFNADYTADPCPGTEEKLIRDEEKAAVARALRQLPENDRCMVYLHYFEGLKYREIAEITGINPSAVKNRLYSARGKIRKELECRKMV